MIAVITVQEVALVVIIIVFHAMMVTFVIFMFNFIYFASLPALYIINI